MSKLRQHIPVFESDLPCPSEGDLNPYVVFTQLKPDGPYFYAGWLDATDDEMAIAFGREHYGQDQKCEHLWAIPRGAISGTEPEHAPPPVRPGDDAASIVTYVVLAQNGDDDLLISTGVIESVAPADALELARRQHTGARRVWVVPKHRIAATDDDDLIWRHTDQTYRLARGYSKDVREKWEKIRKARALTEYEKDDLQETF